MNRCVFSPSILLQDPLTLFSYYIFICFFLSCSFCRHILLLNCFDSFTFGFVIFSCHSRIFFSFHHDGSLVHALRDGKVVFSSGMILFKFSKFISYSCLSVCSVEFGCVMFRSFFICSWFRLECSFLSIFNESVNFSKKKPKNRSILFWFAIYFLAHLKYFKVWRPTFLYYYCSARL